MDSAARLQLTRRAMWISGASVVWALAVGVAAIGAGATARSLALVAFGLESLLDGSASVVLVWRFHVEAASSARADRVEHVAVRIIGGVLLMAGTYIAVQAIRELATRSGPARTTVGVVLAAASVLLLPVLAFVKLRLAQRLRSAALQGDGVLSAAGACLAAAALLGLLLNSAFGWWWADSTAALIIAGALGLAGWRACAT
jgi:divalent metal cation (Fe/Co/Zn/Cd) transporter